MSNEVWEYKLRPVEFVFHAYLCYRQTHGREENGVSVITAANSLRLTTATMKKHLIEKAIDHYHEQQLQRMDAEVERQRAWARLSRLCAPQETFPTAGRPTTPLAE